MIRKTKSIVRQAEFSWRIFVCVLFLIWTVSTTLILQLSRSPQDIYGYDTIRLHVLTSQQFLSNAVKEAFDHAYIKDPKARGELIDWCDRAESEGEEVRQTKWLAFDPNVESVITKIKSTCVILKASVGIDEYNGRDAFDFFDKQIEHAQLKSIQGSVAQIMHRIGEHQVKEERERANTLRLMFAVMTTILLASIAFLTVYKRKIKSEIVTPIKEILENGRQLCNGETNVSPTLESNVAEILDLQKMVFEMGVSIAAQKKTLAISEKESERSSLVPVVAHNIKNPLSTIMVIAESQLSDCEMDDTAKNAAQAIMRSCRRLTGWVDSLLCYLRPISPKFEVISAVEIAEVSASMVTENAKRKGVELQMDPPESNISALVDPALIEQAACCLISNAIEASNYGMTIRLRVWNDADYVNISVIDEAGGIPFVPENTGAMYGPSSKHFGTGLGIPFAMRIAEVHGGHLHYEVMKEKGTVATIKLPILNYMGKQEG